MKRLSARLAAGLPPLASVLAIQLVLTVFAPPIAWGYRSVFLGDLWFFVWPFLYLAAIFVTRPEARGRLLRWILVSSGVFALIFVHGAFRPSLVAPLAQAGVQLSVPDDFLLGREAVVAFRFLSWLLGAVAVAFYGFGSAEKSRERGLIRRAVFWVVLGASLVTVLIKIFPDLGFFFGGIYGYDPTVFPWGDRVYGVFRSPVEEGVFFGLAAILTWPDAGGVTGSGLAVLFARSLTSIVAWGVLLFLAVARRMRLAGALIATGLVSLVGAMAGYFWIRTNTEYTSLPGFIHWKWVNFLSRLGPWKVYLKAAQERWDVLVLGTGFPDYHVDSSYLFLFNRGGLLLFGSSLAFVIWAMRRFWRRWDWAQKSALFFVLISALTVDCVIMRPMVALMVVGMVPLLATREASR